LTGDGASSTELQLPSANGQQTEMERKRRQSMALEAMSSEYSEIDARKAEHEFQGSLMGKDIAMRRTIHWSLLASLLLAPSMTVAQAQKPGPSKDRAQPAAKITEEQAKKIALERIPGEVTDVVIEKKRGKNVYVIEIQSPEQGERDVFVDIETGRIVGTD
jgi:uncharacterized membrane protein YkoI